MNIDRATAAQATMKHRKPKSGPPVRVQQAGSAEAGTWAGKCGACGQEFYWLPEHDEGVCAVCGAAAVFEIVSVRPTPPNVKLTNPAAE